MAVAEAAVAVKSKKRNMTLCRIHRKSFRSNEPLIDVFKTPVLDMSFASVGIVGRVGEKLKRKGFPGLSVVTTPFL